ncbi:MAG: class I SAM-dependent methyltransferase [Hyphomonas sp.]|nr:class I SAM-dependent methyltransferase [Hyphomonas sp.]
MTNTMQQTEAFTGQVVTEVAAAMSGVMTSIGHRLGLYKAMAGAGMISSSDLAARTSLHERYVREWLNNQVAGGYVVFDPHAKLYELPDAHVPVLAIEDSPVFLVPALEVCASLWFDRDKVEHAFRTGDGIAWEGHHESLYCGCEALFKPGYQASLVADWIGALDGVATKLESGGRVADVGCGHGASAILIAEAFPNASVVGIDAHAESVKIAKARAIEAGVGHNLEFRQGLAKTYTEKDFDLICFMDCLHDMGDPVGAAAHAYQALKPGGTLLLVEPAADDGVENNINPVSRLYYAASTGVCTPCSLSQDVQAGLGAQAGPRQLSEVLNAAGFTDVRVAVRAPFNIVLEARKP